MNAYTPGFCLPSWAWDLVYPWQNPDIREILRNLIDCSEDWELEKTAKSRKIKIPDWCIENYNSSFLVQKKFVDFETVFITTEN